MHAKRFCYGLAIFMASMIRVEDFRQTPIYRSGSALNSVNAEVVDGIHMASKTSVNDCNIEIQEF